MYINKMCKISFLVFLLITSRTIAFWALHDKAMSFITEQNSSFLAIQLSLKREGVERNF